MRVCLVSYEFPPKIFGGAGTYADSLSRGLMEEGVDILVIAPGKPTQSTKHVIRISTPGTLYWRRLFFPHYANEYITSVMKNKRIDIVHYNEPHILLSTPKTLIVSTFHSTQINELLTKLQYSKIIETRSLVETLLKSPAGAVGDHLAAHKSHRIITPSDDLKWKISKYCNYDENNIDVIYNGVDLPEINDFDSDKNERYLLYMGRLDPIKGVEYLILAYKELRLEHKDLNLYIVGQGYYEKHLKTIAKSIEGIKFLGHISDEATKKEVYRNCEMLVLPSIYEAMPLVVLEAMAYGKPVIASAVGGIPSIIKDGENGHLTEPRNIKDVKNKIDSMLKNEELKKQIFFNNRKKILEKYSIKAMVRKTIKSYEKAL